MRSMLSAATAFNNDISKWDVSRVTAMDHMFRDAASFKRKLCGAAWVYSTASKDGMFEGSPGSISRRVCEPSTLATRQYISRRSLPMERELIVRAPITTSTNKLSCPKCGTFQKSGKVSCCAPRGAWFKNCGGVGNRNVDHRWSEGVEACKRKSKANSM